ncbi:hypothetical protein ACTFIU_008615 [Dictyostelium citrinum]
MFKHLNNFCFFLVLLLTITIASSQNIVTVNYNVARNYNSFEECGLPNEPVCTSLEDASNRAILWSKIVSQPASISIDVVGDINGSVPVKMGNVFDFCGRLYVRSSPINSRNVIIDGSSSSEPFLSLYEPNEPNSTYPCTSSKSFILRNVDFVHWTHTTMINVSVDHVEYGIPVDPSKYYTVSFPSTTIQSSKSIVKVLPKNYDSQKRYSNEQFSISMASTILTNLTSSNILALGSSEDSLPPFYLIGCSLDVFSLKNSTLLSTPLVYSKNGYVSLNNQAFSNNNFSINPVFLVDDCPLLSYSPNTFNNNVISTFIHFTRVSSSMISTIYINTTQSPFYHRKMYLGYQYEDSFAVVKNCSNLILMNWPISTPVSSNNEILNDLFFVENSQFGIVYSDINSPMSSRHIFNIVDSTLSLGSINLTWSGHEPIIGFNSTITEMACITQDETFCGCENCLYYESFYAIPMNTSDSIQCGTIKTNTPPGCSVNVTQNIIFEWFNEYYNETYVQVAANINNNGVLPLKGLRFQLKAPLFTNIEKISNNNFQLPSSVIEIPVNGNHQFNYTSSLSSMVTTTFIDC